MQFADSPRKSRAPAWRDPGARSRRARLRFATATARSGRGDAALARVASGIRRRRPTGARRAGGCCDRVLPARAIEKRVLNLSVVHLNPFRDRSLRMLRKCSVGALGSRSAVGRRRDRLRRLRRLKPHSTELVVAFPEAALGAPARRTADVRAGADRCQASRAPPVRAAVSGDLAGDRRRAGSATRRGAPSRRSPSLAVALALEGAVQPPSSAVCSTTLTRREFARVTGRWPAAGQSPSGRKTRPTARLTTGSRGKGGCAARPWYLVNPGADVVDLDAGAGGVGAFAGADVED